MSKHAEAVKAAGQEHLLAGWDKLTGEEQQTLDGFLEEVERRVGLQTVRNLLGEAEAAAAEMQAKAISPPTQECFGSATAPEDRARWRALGLELIAAGKAAACVMAGGQGTRLGSAFPKGCLGDPDTPGADFGLAIKKPLFALQAERIKKLEQLAKAAHPASTPTIYFLVMTSHATHKTTTEFFEARGYFGLRPEQVVFFTQGRMPCIDLEGKILMQSAHELCMAPDGNGGIYEALVASGTLAALEKKGVEWVQVFSVDNILVRVADPVFFGFCHERGCDAASKTVLKRDASEAVGVFAKRGDEYGVIEYSEIGEERSKETAPDGSLLYGAANPAIHCYRLSFLAADFCRKKTVWHKAVKNIATVDGTVKGVKLEAFIFDVFAFAKNFGLLTIDRAAEFSAIKNSDDKPRDTPKTAIQDLRTLHASWLKAAGVDVGDAQVEISPARSYDGEGLEDVAAAWPQLLAAAAGGVVKIE